MNAEISEIIRATLLGLGMQIHTEIRHADSLGLDMQIPASSREDS